MKYLIKKPDTFLNTLNDDINSIIQRSFDNLFPEYIFRQELNGMAMPVDIKEYEDYYTVKVELPGIDKENIKVDINKTCMKIEAKKEYETAEDNEKHKYHKSEFRYGNYSRTLYFPQDIDSNKSEATLKNGILCIKLPKFSDASRDAKRLEIKD